MKRTADLLKAQDGAGPEITNGSGSHSRTLAVFSVEFPGGNLSAETLNSWKEIAAYTNRGIRTLQRWEVDLKFPIHRPQGKTGVIAFKSEIDLWFRTPHKQQNKNSLHLRHFEMHRRLRNNTKIMETMTARLVNCCAVLKRELDRALKLTSALHSASDNGGNQPVAAPPSRDDRVAELNVNDAEGASRLAS